MAKDIHKIIRQIQDLLNQNDMTDIKQFQDLANEYGEFCHSYLESCNKVQELLDRKMDIEASALADSFTPALLNQYAAMQFPGLTTFLQILSLYNLALPPKIDSSTLDALQVAKLKNSGYQPLLEEYRKIARSPNLEAKIHLLRQIVPLVQDNQEWQCTLLTLEGEQMEILTKQAQKAIENQDYSTLAELQNKLLRQDWQVKPRPEVLSKIARELDCEYLRQQAILAEELLTKLNNLYSLGTEHIQLGKALQDWEDFQKDTTLDIPEEMLSQVASARQFWQKEHDDHERNQVFQKNLADLDFALEHNDDLENIDRLYFKLTTFDRDIPAELRRRYETYRESKLAIRKRHHLLGYVIAAFLILFLAGAMVVLFKYFSDRHLVKSFRSRLEIALQAPIMDEGLVIKEEMERKHPQILRHPTIQSLMMQLAENKKSEDQRRDVFVGLTRKIREGIPFYGERVREIREDLKAVERSLVDERQRQEYQELSAEVLKAHEKYLGEQEKKFTDLYDAMLQEYQKFKVSLQNQDYSSSRLAIDQVSDLITQSEKLPDIPDTLREKNKYLMNLFEGMSKELQESIKNHNFMQITQKMDEILQEEFPSAEEKQDEQRLHALLKQLGEMEFELNLQIENVSESSKATWQNIQLKLTEAKEVWIRFDEIKKRYETDYKKLWSASGYRELKRGVAEYLLKYPRSPYVAELELFQHQQTARFDDFPQESFRDKHKTTMTSIELESEKARLRVQQTLNKLVQSCQQNPLKMLAFGSLEFNFTEPVTFRKNAVISYLTNGTSRRLTINTDNLLRLDSNDCEIEFDGQKLFAEVTYPPFFQGQEKDFLFPTPHQKILLDLQQKFEHGAAGYYWAGKFMNSCFDLINPTLTLYKQHDFYQRTLVLQEILLAYLLQSQAEPDSTLPEEKTLKGLLEKLNLLLKGLPENFLKNGLTRSHYFTDQYKEFQKQVGMLYLPVIFLEVERTMKQLELFQSSKYTPIGVFHKNPESKAVLTLFAEEISDECTLWMLENNVQGFIPVAKLTASGWSRNSKEQELLRPGLAPVLAFRLTAVSAK